MILELAHNIFVIWPNQLQNQSQRNAHAQVYTNKICPVINQWNRPDCTLEYLDHSAVLCSVPLSDVKAKSPRWRFNVLLLSNKTFITSLK